MIRVYCMERCHQWVMHKYQSLEEGDSSSSDPCEPFLGSFWPLYKSRSFSLRILFPSSSSPPEQPAIKVVSAWLQVQPVLPRLHSFLPSKRKEKRDYQNTGPSNASTRMTVTIQQKYLFSVIPRSHPVASIHWPAPSKK